jgi:hypothetical protein
LGLQGSGATKLMLCAGRVSVSGWSLRRGFTAQATKGSCDACSWPSPVLLGSSASYPIEVPMRRIGLAVVLTVSLTLAPLAVEAQQASKVYKIGLLAPVPGTVYMMPFVASLRELGWIEGRNFTLESRFSGEPPKGLTELRANSPA